MKKLIAAAAAVFCMAVSAHAQIGITAGLTSTSSTLKDAKVSFESGNVNQYHVGLVYKIGLGNILAIQPGLVYNVKGSSFDISNIGSTSVDFKTGFLEIPVQVQAGLGIGKIGASAMESMARQPEMAGNIRTSMLIIAALIEGVAMFAVIVCFIAVV